MSENVKELIKRAEKTHEIIDDLGRIITLRKPGMLAQYRFVEMLGRSADSESFMNMTMPLRYVIGIDDDDKVACGTRRELDALIQRLGEEGVTAVMKGVNEQFAPASAEEEKSELKK